MAFVPSKRGRGKFAFSNFNSTDYYKYARQYARTKAEKIRCVYGWMNGTRVLNIFTDVSKCIVIDYGKRKFTAVCINVDTYIISPALVVFTNASRIVNIAKNIHSTSAFCFECIEDSTNLAFLPLDLALFGQPIPIGASNHFNLFGNKTNFLDV